MDGENEAKSCTCVSMVKSLTAESGRIRGSMYCFNASSISHAEGVADAANSEKVR